VAIAALAVWAVTMAAGAYLLTHVIAAKRAAAAAAPVRDPATMPVAATVPAPGSAAASSVVFPAIPRTKVTAGPDDHPLREFSHPALALAGLGCWLAFTATHDLAFGWLACGALAATAGIGLSWLVSNARSARQRQARQRQARQRQAKRHEATGAGAPDADRPGGADPPGTDQPGARQLGRDLPGVPAHLVAVHGLAAATTIGLVLATIVTAAHP
jgi:hypothetical protein